MIARWFVPALVLALPLVTEAQAPRARWSTAEATGAEAPAVRVWIPGSWSLRIGQPVGVSFEVSEAAHVAVFRVDGSGRLMVLWPERNGLQTAVRAGREYRVRGPRSNYAAFAADYEIGQGMVIAIASSDPIDLSTFRRYRNDQAYYRYASVQRPYIGGVKSVVDRVTQEILYAINSPYDYDIAFYSVTGHSFYASAYCDNHFTYFGGVRYPRAYGDWGSAYGYSGFDDCYRSSLYHGYLAYCSAWYAFSGFSDSNWCRFGNPFWPSTPGPIAGGPQPQPRPNTDMIDTIMSRPVDKYPIIDRNTEQPSTGTTRVITMEPVRHAPNGTRWLPEDDSHAISIPSRFRREPGDPGRQGGRINTREEGFTRSPGTGIRVSDPSAGNRPTPPERSPGNAVMPPVREVPHPTTWRDGDRDGSNHAAPQRWLRPSTSEPRSARPSSGSDRIDRGSTPAGTSSPSTGGATVTPRTDASVTKTETKAPDAKSTGERKPQ
ncbi:MAG: DUF4384 domain-containing protein [Gemmatimonadaceae bacterium]